MSKVQEIRNITILVMMTLVSTACIEEKRDIEIFSDGQMTVESEIIVTQKDGGEAVIEVLDDIVEDWNSKEWKAGYKVLRKKHPMKLQLNAEGHISKIVGRFNAYFGYLYILEKKSSTEYQLTMSGMDDIKRRLEVNFLTSLLSSNATVTDEKNQSVKKLDLSVKGKTVKIFLKPSKSKNVKKPAKDKSKQVALPKRDRNNRGSDVGGTKHSSRPGNVYFRSIASPSLSVRESSSTQSRKIGKIPENERVKVIASTGIKETIGGKKGEWKKIEYNGIIGYAFDAFLVPDQ